MILFLVFHARRENQEMEKPTGKSTILWIKNNFNRQYLNILGN